MAEGQAQLAVLQQDAVQMKEQQRLDFNRLCQLDELNTQLQVCFACAFDCARVHAGEHKHICVLDRVNVNAASCTDLDATSVSDTAPL